MKHALLILAAFSLLATAHAAPPDVPAGHWAARAVGSVTAKKLMASQPDGRFHGDKPVTRYELAVVLDRFVRYIEAGRKPLHATQFPARLTLPPTISPDVRQALTHLVANGFLPVNSPLLTRPGAKPATARELSDAMAQVTIRLSDRSLPPTKG